MTAYYNENDPYAAQWLRNLIAENLIAKGEVDERSITEVKPGDLTGFDQCHFFAGIGGWSYALRLAGWADDKPAWTGSCPCQPFAGPGKGAGFDDARHLWPVWLPLIRERRHRTWFVADADNARWEGRIWQGQPDETWQARQAARREPVRPACGYWPARPGEIEQIPRTPDGIPNLLGRCRAYGNAIVPQVAAEFIKAYMEIENGHR